MPAPSANWDAPAWQLAETLRVTHFPWEDSGHRPNVQARALYDNEALYIHFRVEDQYVRAVAEKFQDSVCVDSCVEFFVSPLADSEAYFNFEVNCGGTMLLHRCPSPAEKAAGRATEDVSDADGATIQIAHSMPKIVDPEITEETTWTAQSIEYRSHCLRPTLAAQHRVGAISGAPISTNVLMPRRTRTGDRGHPLRRSGPISTSRPTFSPSHLPDGSL